MSLMTQSLTTQPVTPLVPAAVPLRSGRSSHGGSN